MLCVQDNNVMLRCMPMCIEAKRTAAQVPGWEVGKSVYFGKHWVPPAQPVGVYREILQGR